MPTRDEDWHRLIEGNDPNDPLASATDQAAGGWLLFEAYADMDSAKAVHDAIALSDDLTVRRALLAAVIGRRGTGLTEENRLEWMNRGATPADLLGMFEFGSP
jgi:hypothetical protein